MPLYRKKPVTINADQFFPDKKPWPQGVYEVKRAGVENKFKENRIFKIETLEGTVNVSVGDWIITGVEGEKYPCRPDIFEKTYEKVKGID